MKSFRKNCKSSILFITYTFLSHGGLETRVRLYADAYWERGWNVYIEPTEFRGSDTHGFKLRKNRFLNTCWLILWRFTRNIRIIEWQSGGPRRIQFYPFPLRLLGIKLGIVFHGLVGPDVLQNMRYFHYAICVSEAQQKRYQALSACTVIPNTLPAIGTLSAIWQWQGQTRALYISRLDEDKMPSIQAFIDFCTKYHIHMDIAGSGFILQHLKEKYGSEICFLGAIETNMFLQNQRHKYLFVSGIGQVALEGLASGYPVLIAPLIGEKYCFFVTNENLQKLQIYNFSPHTETEAACFEVDIKQAHHQLKQLLKGTYKTSWLSQEQVFSKYNFNKMFEKYWQTVFEK